MDRRNTFGLYQTNWSFDKQMVLANIKKAFGLMMNHFK